MIGLDSGGAVIASAPAGPVIGRGQRKLPDDYAGFRDFVVRRRSCLPRQLRLAADYLVAHPDEVAFEPLVTIGKRAGVSPSCIVRLSQRLGFDGFSQLQRLFQRRLVPAEPVPLVHRLPAKDPLHESIEATEHALRCLDRSTSRELLGRAVQMLIAADRVFVMGEGLSAGPALLAAEAFRSAGCRTVLLDCKAEADLPAVVTTVDACLIFDLGAGGSIALPMIKALRQRRIATILISIGTVGAGVTKSLIGFELGQEGSSPASAATSAACLVLTITKMMVGRQEKV